MAQATQHQHFLLKWNNHRSNLVNVFESLLQKEHFTDVTLAVEGKFLKAHKIVLSACSPYFSQIFVQTSDKHPIIIFHDLKYVHLKTLLEFMYRGEISIDEKDLSDILKVAETLLIRGLSSFDSDDEDGEGEKDKPSNNAKSPNTSGSSGENKASFTPATPSTTETNHHNHRSSSPSQISSNLESVIAATASLNGSVESKPERSKKNLGESSGSSGKSGRHSTPIKRRGRKAVKKSIPALNEIKPGSTISKLPPRQGVRRRMPKKLIKREQLPDDMIGDELEDFLDIGSEPLSEMSVRGLDLFKYASIEEGVYRCMECEKMRIPKTFKNKYSFQRHAFLYHEGNLRKVFPCPVCSREFSRPDKMKNHLRSVHLHQTVTEESPASSSPATTMDNFYSPSVFPQFGESSSPVPPLLLEESR